MPRASNSKETHPFGPNPMALYRCSCGAKFAISKFMFANPESMQVHCPQRIYGKCDKVYSMDYLETLAKRAKDVHDIQIQDAEGASVEDRQQRKRTVRTWNND